MVLHDLDTLSTVLSFLRPRDLARAACVCREWRTSVNRRCPCPHKVEHQSSYPLNCDKIKVFQEDLVAMQLSDFYASHIG